MFNLCAAACWSMLLLKTTSDGLLSGPQASVNERKSRSLWKNVRHLKALLPFTSCHAKLIFRLPNNKVIRCKLAFDVFIWFGKKNTIVGTEIQLSWLCGAFVFHFVQRT